MGVGGLLLALLLVGRAGAAEVNCSATAVARELFPAGLDAGHGLLDYGQPAALQFGTGSCLAHARATCCSRAQTDVVMRHVVLMDRADFSRACREATEKALCAVACDADVGLGKKPARLCDGACHVLFEACKNDFYSPSGVGFKRAPVPCIDSALVCSRLGDVYISAKDFCEAMYVGSEEEDDTHQCVGLDPDPSRRGVPLHAFFRKGSESSSMNLTPLGVLKHLLQQLDNYLSSTSLGRWLASYQTQLDRGLAMYQEHHLRTAVIGGAGGFLLAVFFLFRFGNPKPTHNHNNNDGNDDNDFRKQPQ